MWFMKLDRNHVVTPPNETPREKKDQTINFWMTVTQLAELDAWRARNHVWSRSAALRHLVAHGLAHAEPAAERVDEAA
jgi:hypothetical protein